MGFKLIIKFNANDVRKVVESRVAKIEEIMIQMFGYIGESFVANARDEASKWDYVEKQQTSKWNAIEQKFEKAQSLQETYYRNGKRYNRLPGAGPSFSDWTGNLRSSIGFVILKNGEVISQVFDGEKEAGKEAGIAVTNEISKNFPKGIVLIVVAGESYAAYVESKGYDVITGSSLIAEDALRKAIKSIPGKISKMKHDMSINWEQI